VAVVAALVLLVALVGGAAFAVTRGDSPPPTTTTSTTTTAAPPTRSEIATAIAAALTRDLEVPLTRVQATCVADAFLDVVGEAPTLALADVATPLGAVTIAQRAEIVRGIVACVPADVAAALLSTGATTVTLAPGLPDEG
jgi:hypothetical protein